MTEEKTIATTRGVDKQLFEYHPVVGYRFIPNLQTRVQHESGGYLVKANSLGFRSDQEFTPTKKDGQKRILLFGDSFTEGDGVSNKKRYSDVLMQLLPNTEVFNFGLRGTGTDQQYLIYNEFAKSIEHDLVMIVVYVENIRRVNAKYRFYLNADGEKIVYQKPYFELAKNGLVLRNTPVNPNQLKFEELPEEEKGHVVREGRFAGLRRLVNKLGLKEIAQKVSHYQQYHEYSSSRTKEWQLMKGILTKWISETDKPVLLVTLPTHHYVDEGSDFTVIDRRFKELEGMKNLTVFNPLSEFKKFPLEERRKFRFGVDVHPTPLGHQVYAQTFQPVIERILNKK
jgi:hypothetical protein